MSEYALYAIGNALVDVEFAVSEDFLDQHDISKGHMTLIDAEQMETLLGNLSGARKRACGGSAANTVIACSQFGAPGFYSCRVANDDTGQFFLRDMEDAGVNTNFANGNLPPAGVTGSCAALVTPDAERSMHTHLGVSWSLGPENVVEEAIHSAERIYVEGYLAASPTAVEAALLACETARRCGAKISLTLSDHTMVKGFREQLTRIIGSGVDHLFCNEEEALDWAQTDSLDSARAELLQICKTCSITLGAAGSTVFDGEKWHEVEAVPCQPIDTLGAGDLYAGAFIYGLSAGWDHVRAARLASAATARLITRFGARLGAEDYPLLLQHPA